jgi:hypothetical protein
MTTTPSVDDKYQIDVQTVFFEDPLLLGDPQRRHFVLVAPRDQQFTRLCRESCRPMAAAKKPQTAIRKTLVGILIFSFLKLSSRAP